MHMKTYYESYGFFCTGKHKSGPSQTKLTDAFEGSYNPRGSLRNFVPPCWHVGQWSSDQFVCESFQLVQMFLFQAAFSQKRSIF